MKILLSTNRGPRCGVSQVGFLMADALRRGGNDVVLWEHDYPNYLPENAGTFDVVHINFHPGTAGHLQREHLPNGPLLSVWHHEFSPLWEQGHPAPSLWTAPDVVKFCSDPTSPFYWPLPIPDYRPIPTSTLGRTVRIGLTGLRRDGWDHILPVCERMGWKVSLPSEGWVPLEEEIDRLSKCHLNVVHCHSGYSGSSSAVTTAVAARRPVLINSNQLLHGIWEMDQRLGRELYRIEDFQAGAEQILEDIDAGRAKRPLQLAARHCYSEEMHRLVMEWERLKKR